MARYVHDIGFRTEDYRKHLQENAYAQDVKSEVASSSQAIIASNERLQREGIRTTEGIREGMNQISFSVRDLASGILTGQRDMTEALWANVDRLDDLIELQNRIGYALNLGFRGVSEAIYAVRDLLRESIMIAKHPSETWANEQFDTAKKTFQKGWTKETLTALNRAIHGHESHPGYEIDHRFHFLKGLVLSGSANPKETEVVNLPKAEESFLLAVRYSKLDQPKQAARAYFLASWAAYCDGKNDQAIKHGLSALEIDNNPPEYSYNLAKYLFHANRAKEGSKYLETAILKNKFYSIEAASDADFQKHLGTLNSVLERLRAGEESKIRDTLHKIKDLLAELYKRKSLAFPPSLEKACRAELDLDKRLKILMKGLEKLDPGQQAEILEMCVRTDLILEDNPVEIVVHSDSLKKPFPETHKTLRSIRKKLPTASYFELLDIREMLSKLRDVSVTEALSYHQEIAKYEETAWIKQYVLEKIKKIETFITRLKATIDSLQPARKGLVTFFKKDVNLKALNLLGPTERKLEFLRTAILKEEINASFVGVLLSDVLDRKDMDKPMSNINDREIWQEIDKKWSELRPSDIYDSDLWFDYDYRKRADKNTKLEKKKSQFLDRFDEIMANLLKQ